MEHERPQQPVVLITGASSGIGEATARTFAKAGARIVLVARRRDRLELLSQELGPERTLVAVCDVRDKASVVSAVQAAMQRFERLDVVVNNAGRGMYADVVEIDNDAWQTLWATNVQGPLNVIQAAAPFLRKGAVVVNVSSIVGRVAVPHMGAYSATKAALGALSDALRIELAPQGIRVMTVYPGSTRTEFREHAAGADHMVTRRVVRVAPQRVAQAIYQGVKQGRSRVWVTWTDRLLATTAQMLPGLADRVLGRTMRASADHQPRLQ